MFLQISDEKKVQFIMDGIETIIWPLTLFVLLIVFKKYFINAMSRLGSVEAGTSGIKMTFDHSIANAKKLLKGIQPNATSKSSKNIEIQPKQSKSYAELIDIKMKLNLMLVSLANENGINSEETTTEIVCEKLKETGVITLQKAQLIQAFYQITNTADVSFSKAHLEIAKDLYSAINQ